MKLIKSILVFALLLSVLSSCNKDDNNSQSYRLVSFISTIYEPNYLQYSGTMTYENDHIISSITEEVFKKTYSYVGDSIITFFYLYEDNQWELKNKSVSHISNNLITMINGYQYPDTTKSGTTYYKYDSDKLTEINTYDSSGIYSFSKYEYDQGLLIMASFSYRLHDNEYPTEYIRREFAYENNKLHQELVYRYFNGYPIQLAYKILYHYENEKLTQIETFKVEGEVYKPYQKENYSYDNAGNNISVICYDSSGSLIYDSYAEFEPGFYKNQLIYNVMSGYESETPLTSILELKTDSYSKIKSIQ